MSTLVIPDLDDTLYEQLERRALSHSRLLEDEARETLRLAMEHDPIAAGDENLVELALKLFGPENGVDLDLPPRNADRDRPPPDFSGPEYDR